MATTKREKLFTEFPPVSTEQWEEVIKADLKGANLSDANLQEVKLSGSNLENADLTGTRTRFGNFQDAYMEGCTNCPKGW